ncbi:synaptogenesis protein syg-1-like [Anabrus simplex]|uniref:synaptogenesis protein syg-1-like n=1 Tax=Anabrus simplex TaxID=316456 RepID=UPI0035A2D697
MAKNLHGQVPEAPLPYDKVKPSKAFEVTGMDFMGLLYVSMESAVNFCAADFTYATTLAVHLELCSCRDYPYLQPYNVVSSLSLFLALGTPQIYDIRGKHSELASHWRDKEILEERGYFRTITEPATLSLDNIDERDEGIYRCRVDFRQSPTRNTKVKLTVIVPPQKPNIFDARGKEVPSFAGPYEEGGDMILTCIVSGGRPLPTVRWWRGETLVDSQDTISAFPNVKHNQLVVTNLQRNDLHAVFTCQASNNNISQPVSASVSIEMHFKPLSATILSSNQPLSADRKYEIVCQSVGSRPPAKISWWIDNQGLDNCVEKVSADGNVTVSTLTFTPTSKDNDKVLTCRAENPQVRAGVEEDTWRLNVFYIPMLELQLGSNLNPDDIEEGDDVYFECKVRANPWAYKVVWKHNGQILQHNQKAGVIMINEDLALQSVRRHQAGNYTCIASNVEGDGESNTVELRVMYKPICHGDQKRVYGVAKLENAQVMCRVEAYPPPDSFKWSFNNTAEIIDVPQARYSRVDYTPLMSILSYTPMMEMDYGTVMCWASNTAGQQREPCVFHIIAAGRPDMPFNCSLVNQTSQSLEVECLEGFDGGQPQYFILEVYDLQTGFLQANLSSKFPTFIVGGLGPGMILKMMVYAANNKGKSDPVTLEGFTLKAAEKQTGTPASLELTPILLILIGVVAALLLIAIIIMGAMRLRSQHRPARPANLTLKEKAVLPLRTETEEKYNMDDKNPDVIPCNKDSDYQLVSGAQTPGVTKETPPELPSYEQHTKWNNTSRNGDLFENYKNTSSRTRPVGHRVSEEVTYAELSLVRPTTLHDTGLTRGSSVILAGSSSGGVRVREEATIYAQIDHSRRPPPSDSVSTPLVSPASHPSFYPREIVTVRTPLISNQQESCV